METLGRLLLDDQAQGLGEYLVIFALAALALLATMTVFPDKLDGFLRFLESRLREGEARPRGYELLEP